MRFMHGIGLGLAWVKKTDTEITSVYLMSSVNSLKNCFILIYDLKVCSHHRLQNAYAEAMSW